MNRIGKVTKIEIIRQFIYRKIKLVSVLEYNVGNFVVVTVQLHAKSGAALFFQRRNKPFQYGRIMKRNIPAPLIQLITNSIKFLWQVSDRHHEMLLKGDDLRSFSGTVVLYKQLSSGAYQKIKSESLNINAVNGKVTHSGSTSSQGSGKYRVTYSGTAYFGKGSESVEITTENSY